MIYSGGARARWWALVGVLVAQSGAVLMAGVASWYGWLPAGTADLEKISIWGSPLIAAGTAAMAAGLRLHRAEDWAVVGGRPRRELYVPALQWGAAAAAAATTTAAVAVLVLCRDGITGASLLRFAVAWATLVAVGVCSAAFGVLMARWMSPWLAPVVAFVAPYVVFVALTSSRPTDPIGSLTVPSTLGQDYARIALPSYLARAATAVFLAAAAAGALVHPPGRRRQVLTAGASVALAAAFLTAGPVQGLPGATRLTCTGQDPVVCLDATQEGTRPAYTAGVRAAVGMLPPRLRPERVIGSPMADGGRGDLVAPPMAAQHVPARRITASAVATEVGEALFASDCVDDRVQGVSATLVAWWRLRTGSSLSGGLHASQADLTASPDFADEIAEARRWRALPGSREAVAVEQAAAALARCPRR